MGNEFQKLKTQRDTINNLIIDKLEQDKVHLKIMADNMAEAATNIQGQGYGSFVNARESFLSEIDRVVEEYSVFICASPSLRFRTPK